MKTISIAAMAILAPSYVSAADKCRALAFSSGDEDSAYQAGALKGIVESSLLSGDDFKYDSVSGVSDGALNAAILANYTMGDEAAAVSRME